MSKSKSAAALRKVLEDHTASEISGQSTKNGGSVIELDSNMKPSDAANVLWENNILGAPVWSEAEKKYVGFVDMRDMLSVVVATAKKGMTSKDSDDKFDYDIAIVDELNALSGRESGTTLTYLAARNPFVSSTPESTLLALGQVLISKRSHRMPIVASEGEKCSGIISQSALVKFLSKSIPKEELEESISDAGLPYAKAVVSIVDSAPAFEAFELMDSQRLSGLAVVDEEGELIGNTSARDIKLAAHDKGLQSMETDILSYLAAVRQSSLVERYPIAHVYEDATVAHVVNLLAKTGYHRVFVVDKEKRPVGVISVTDIVKFAIGDIADPTELAKEEEKEYLC